MYLIHLQILGMEWNFISPTDLSEYEVSLVTYMILGTKMDNPETRSLSM